MKAVSKASNKPLFQKLFEDPNATSIGDQQLLHELNIQMNQNPNFVIPDGYIKVRQPIVFEKYAAPAEFDHQEPIKISMEIINDIFTEEFKTPMLDP